MPVAQVEQQALSKGLSEDQAQAVASDYGDAQLDALRISIGAVAVIALLSLWFTRKLPTSAVAPADRAGTGRGNRARLTSAPDPSAVSGRKAARRPEPTEVAREPKESRPDEAAAGNVAPAGRALGTVRRTGSRTPSGWSCSWCWPRYALGSLTPFKGWTGGAHHPGRFDGGGRRPGRGGRPTGGCSGRRDTRARRGDPGDPVRGR